MDKSFISLFFVIITCKKEESEEDLDNLESEKSEALSYHSNIFEDEESLKLFNYSNSNEIIKSAFTLSHKNVNITLFGWISFVWIILIIAMASY